MLLGFLGKMRDHKRTVNRVARRVKEVAADFLHGVARPFEDAHLLAAKAVKRFGASLAGKASRKTHILCVSALPQSLQAAERGGAHARFHAACLGGMGGAPAPAGLGTEKRVFSQLFPLDADPNCFEVVLSLHVVYSRGAYRALTPSSTRRRFDESLPPLPSPWPCT